MRYISYDTKLDRLYKYKVFSFAVSLTDTEGNLFGGTELPLSLLLSDFDEKFFFFDGENSNGEKDSLTGSITSLTEVSPVPVPAALPLLLSGLLGLGAMGWRKRKTA